MLTGLLCVVMLVMGTMTPRDCMETPVWIIQSTVVLSKQKPGIRVSLKKD